MEFFVLLALIIAAIVWAITGHRAHAQRAVPDERAALEAVQLHERGVPGVCVDKAMWAVRRLEAGGIAAQRLAYVVLKGYGGNDHVVVWLDHHVVLDSLMRGLTEWADYDPDKVVGFYPATASREQLARGIG